MPKDKNNDALLLNNQLCFPLYACSRKIISAYTPFLKAIGLTYTQYVTMMVMWEEKMITVHDLGKKLYLDSGTLTPVLKRLENLGYISRYRKKDDERMVIAELTEQGAKFKKQAENIPYEMVCLLTRKGNFLTPEDASLLKKQLYQIINALE